MPEHNLADATDRERLPDQLRDKILHLTAERDTAHRLLAGRERELLDLKGPCSNKRCRLHYAHSGPCDEQS